MKMGLHEQTKKSEPLVSVIMPVLNASRFVKEALNSVLNQSYKNWELIAINDGSSDNSLKILRDYSKLDKRIKVYANSANLGVSKTSNYGISKAAGKFITRFDADDIMPAKRLEKQVAYLLNHKDVIVVGGQVVLMSENGQKLGYKKFPTDHASIYVGMYNYMTVQQGAMMVDSTKLPSGFVWYKDNDFTAEEVDLFFRLFEYGNSGNLSDVALFYRQYASSTSLKDPKKTFYNTYNARRLATSHYGYKPTLKCVVVNYLQLLAVYLLPSKLIYPVFTLMRGIRLARPTQLPLAIANKLQFKHVIRYVKLFISNPVFNR